MPQVGKYTVNFEKVDSEIAIENKWPCNYCGKAIAVKPWRMADVRFAPDKVVSVVVCSGGCARRFCADPTAGRYIDKLIKDSEAVPVSEESGELKGFLDLVKEAAVGMGLKLEAVENVNPSEPEPKFQVRPAMDGFVVFNTHENVAITKVCPEEIAHEICEDFNKMDKKDFTPIGFPDFSKKGGKG